MGWRDQQDRIREVYQPTWGEKIAVWLPGASNDIDGPSLANSRNSTISRCDHSRENRRLEELDSRRVTAGQSTSIGSTFLLPKDLDVAIVACMGPGSFAKVALMDNL